MGGVYEPGTGALRAKTTGFPRTGSLFESKSFGNGKQATGACPAAPAGASGSTGTGVLGSDVLG